MQNVPKYTFKKRKRATTKVEILTRRFKNARANLAIEGLHLTTKEVAVFELCIQQECTFEERSDMLQKHFPGYDGSVRT